VSDRGSPPSVTEETLSSVREVIFDLQLVTGNARIPLIEPIGRNPSESAHIQGGGARCGGISATRRWTVRCPVDFFAGARLW